MKSFQLDQIKPGTVFECRIYTSSGLRLAEPYTVLGREQLKQLKDWGVDELQAESEPMSEQKRKQYLSEVDVSDESTPVPVEVTQPPQSEQPTDVSSDEYHRTKKRVASVPDDIKVDTQSAYKQTLESVATCATGQEVDQVAAHIKSHIHENGERRRNRKVRRTARQIVSQAGYPADTFLNAA